MNIKNSTTCSLALLATATLPSLLTSSQDEARGDSSIPPVAAVVSKYDEESTSSHITNDIQDAALTRLNELSLELEQIKKECENFDLLRQQKLEEAEQLVVNARAHVQEARQNVQQIVLASVEIDEVIASNSEKLRLLTEDIDSLNSETAKFKKSLANLAKSIKNAKKTLSSQTSKRKSLDKTLDTLKKKTIPGLDKQISSLKNKIEDLDNQLHKRSGRSRFNPFRPSSW